MFTPSDIAKAVHVVDSSGAADMLEAMRGKAKSGRPSAMSPRLFLIGALLSALEGDGMVLTNVYDVLTRRMDFDWQVRLGIRPSVSSAPSFGQDSVDRMSASIRDAAEYGEDSAPDLDADEREARRDRMTALIDALVDATLLPTDSAYRSIDASNVWAWGRSPSRRGPRALQEDAEALEAEGRLDDAEYMREVVRRMKEPRAGGAGAGAQDPPPAEASSAPRPRPQPHGAADSAEEPDADADEEEAAAVEGPGKSKRKCDPHDPDARSSGKTGKDGRTEWFYGYTVSALVRVAGPEEDYQSEPRLVERLEVTPGGRDMIRASRSLIERAAPTERSRTLLGDRWYSNLKEDNWYHFLRARGWDQAVDMRENDQRWTDVRGMRVTAGWPHCPATPDRFERISKPWGSKDAFHEAIDERWAWAMNLHAEDVEAGTRRFMCPALAGKLRCPLRPETMVGDADRPLVENPPAARTAPDCCTVKSTVTIHASDPNARARLWQPRYFGTPEHTRQMDRRTSV